MAAGARHTKVVVMVTMLLGFSATVSLPHAAGAPRAQASDSMPSSSAVPPAEGRAGNLTPQGWQLTPAGNLITVPQMAVGFQGPLGLAISPDGSHALASSSGAAAAESVDLFDLGGQARVAYVPYVAANGAAAFYGVTYSPDGRTAWASGGGENVVHMLSVTSTGLAPIADIPAGDFPAGIAYGHTPLGDRIYVANNLSQPTAGPNPYANPPGHTVTVIDPATRSAVATIDLGAALEPLGVTFDRTGERAFVTNWMGRSVSVVDTRTQQKIADIVLSPRNDPLLADHPSAITANPVRDEVYTANANSDTVSVINSRTDTLEATIDVGFIPGGVKGATPDGLAVSPDGQTLYVTNAGDNTVAVVDLNARRTIGFIPTAWYPTDVKVTPDGRHLVVLSQKGFGAGPNVCGPFSPLACTGVPVETQYVGAMMKGMIQVINLPVTRGQLALWTLQSLTDDHVFLGNKGVPVWLRGKIKHVIYIIKENRSYDQVYGDLGEGNGDPALTIFHDESAPNHRQLARQFVLFDNFYTDSDVSADGHPWVTQANATDYVEKTWPIDYSPSTRYLQRNYDEEFVPLADQFTTEPLASDPSVPRSAAAQTVGYIWDNAYDHGVSFRDYGEATRWADPNNCTDTNFSDLTRLSNAYGNHVDPSYPGWNLSCSDHNSREPAWEKEFQGFVQTRTLPALEIVYFPNDHNAGTAPGYPTPRSYMADNDVALGRLVDTVSHSPYWKDTAIFVVEDDAQNGPDHVDAHRAPALVISPYTQTGAVDSTNYDQAAVVATIEDLLGLPPMSTFDDRATRMWDAFTAHPNFAPYTEHAPTIIPFDDPGYPVNTKGSPLAAASGRQDFSRPDAASQLLLNEATWKSIKGAGSTMPAPICPTGCDG